MEYKYDVYERDYIIEANGHHILSYKSDKILTKEEALPRCRVYNWNNIDTFDVGWIWTSLKQKRKGRIFSIIGPSGFGVSVKEWKMPLEVKITTIYKPQTISWNDLQECPADRVIAYCVERGINVIRA